MKICRSVTQQIMQTTAVKVPSAFLAIANTKIGGQVILPIIYWLVIAVILHIISKKTPFGRQVFAIGSNERTARLSGINVEKVKWLVYVLSGFLVSIAAIIQVARIGSMDYPNAGSGYEMDAIAAVVIGGTSMSGGEGSMLVNGEEEQYEANWSVATVEPGQTFGEVLELDTIAAVTAEGKIFVGWTVYEYNAETMETSETCVQEEGVLCFELFDDYHMVLREYTVCHELLSTEELSAIVCEASDHAVVATWMTAEEYLTFVKKQSDAIKTSLEQEPLTQTDMNQKSEELRALWDETLNLLLDEAKKLLPEADVEKLTTEQSDWEADMAAAVETAGKEFEGGSLYPLIVNTEAAKLTEERVYKLYELLK